ncbi:YggS family pyridoxal phosphate-dependent enzyme [bacterium]|nr:YggS family pyridoxal phosphate-dependent enzyme [bacterium]
MRQVRSDIERACSACGREAGGVRLIGVSKFQPIEYMLEARQAGLIDFGENYVQEAQRKASQLSGVRWHLIGHLQHNKVNAAVRFADVIHSLDSAELIEHVDRACLAAGRSIEGLLQIRLGGEESKSGIDPEDLNALLEALSLNAPRSLRLVGLMTIPPPCAEAAESRRYFVMLRDILADISARGYSFWQGRELSMGMSCDYIEAIKAGATYIRVGRALFGERRTGNGRH